MAYTQSAYSYYANAFNSASGQLARNTVLEELFDKVSRQTIVDNFDFDFPLLTNYLKASTMYGGLDEIASVGLGHLEQFNEKNDWTKEQAIPETFVVWAPIEFEDKYFFTIKQDRMARAFLNESEFVSFLQLYKRAILDRKKLTWFERIKQLHKSYKTVIEVPADDTEAQARIITKTMKDLTNPSTKFNIAGKPTAIPYSRQQLIWNNGSLNDVEWLTSRLFDATKITESGKVLNSYSMDYEDESIVAVLDTFDTIYIGQKFVLTGLQDIVAEKRSNEYLHETYSVVVVPFQPQIIFKKSGESSKVELNSVVKVIGLGAIDDTEDATILAALKAKNSDVDTANLTVHLTSTNTARINVSPANTKYTGFVDVVFNVSGEPSVLTIESKPGADNLGPVIHKSLNMKKNEAVSIFNLADKASADALMKLGEFPVDNADLVKSIAYDAMKDGETYIVLIHEANGEKVVAIRTATIKLKLV